MQETMQGLKRSSYCGDFSIQDIGREVVVCGWVQRQRDLGQLIFVDLRDRTGFIQLAFDSQSTDKEIFDKSFRVRAEFVLCAKGIIRERTSKNPNVKTGDVELEVTDLRVLSQATTPPFEIVENSAVREELRLRYRYLDLRRPDAQEKIIMRHKIVKIARDFLDSQGFIEVETPMLMKSTPEGARDYLVPSREFPGKFFALPQSPQLYKQLTMLAGFDRYFQVARCFRDEDLRADRQPEFTQVDLEMSFVDAEEIMSIAEGIVTAVYKAIDVDVPTQFPRMTYDEAMRRFGSEKPDLRFGMELHDATNILKDTQFKVFKDALNGAIMGINCKELAAKLTRKEIDKLAIWVKDYGALGLAYTRINADGSSTSSYEKFLSENEVGAIRTLLGAQPGDVVFLVADARIDVVHASLGALRCELAHRFNMVDNSRPNLLWVTDFPLFEYNDEEKRYVAKHHPFTMPKDEDIQKLESNPDSVRAKAYDLVLNGNEIGGGSMRIYDHELQQRMFRVLNFSDQQINERFGFLVDAFKFGAPPHGGLAFGLDRLVMIMLNCESIRDVIAFPKVSNSSELMTGAPGDIDVRQLSALAIKI